MMPQGANMAGNVTLAVPPATVGLPYAGAPASSARSPGGAPVRPDPTIGLAAAPGRGTGSLSAAQLISTLEMRLGGGHGDVLSEVRRLLEGVDRLPASVVSVSGGSSTRGSCVDRAALRRDACRPERPPSSKTRAVPITTECVCNHRAPRVPADAPDVRACADVPPSRPPACFGALSTASACDRPVRGGAHGAVPHAARVGPRLPRRAQGRPAAHAVPHHVPLLPGDGAAW